MRVLLLGGTTEATVMANTLHEAGIDAVFSYAGRTLTPVEQPIETRVGGLGGVDGLAAYLRDRNVSHVIDATHPFAAQISTNAVAACQQAGVLLCALERAKWQPDSGDNWIMVPDMQAAVAALPDDPARVFLAIGRQMLAMFSAKPQHFYLLRIIDAPTERLPLPQSSVVLDRGPFTIENDQALLLDHTIDWVVAKNGGSDGARAKLDAARDLGLRVIMVDRPVVPRRRTFGRPDQVMRWLGHDADRGV